MLSDTRLKRHGWVGLVVLIISQTLLMLGVERVATWFYYCAWWSYILIIDSLIYRIKGNSLLMNRRGECVVLALWSIVIWIFFEAANLVMQNWYYVNVIPVRSFRWPGYALAYATVLPGLFETTELLESLGLFRSARVPPAAISAGTGVIMMLCGMACLALILLFPAYCYPLIWISLVLLLEPVNYRCGAKSLLREWEQGSVRTLCLLLAAGGMCGLLWEFWNFWAATKWIYTVPFFDELKLFEMPLLGFLGFPPFTVECYCAYNFISLFRHRRGWEEDSYGLNRHKKVHFALIAAAVSGGIFFCAITFHAMDAATVHSYWSKPDDLSSVSPDAARRLDMAGIRTPRALLQRLASLPQREALARTLAVPEAEMESWIAAAELAELKGMGARNANLLIAAGIRNVAELARLDLSQLAAMLDKTYRLSAERHAPPPRPSILRIWISEARKKTGHSG